MDGIEVKFGDFVFPIDPFSLLCVGIYKSSFTSEIAALLSLTEAQFESTE